MRLDKSDLRALGYKGIAAGFIIAAVLAFIYQLLTGMPFIVGLLAMLLAVFGSYLVFMSFEKEVVPPKMDEGESILLESIDQGYVLFPSRRGRLLGRRSHKYMGLYLTNKRIIGKEIDVVLDIPLESIKSVVLESKLFRDYLRINYLVNNVEKDVLVVPGDSALWNQKLRELGVG
ncbi:MAG: hypothetical protein B6U97_00825 [Candidatus Altiarchaeales archaeon ex4484_96]|nr:MAG: hypothetical protein B6U97_00825 [Candidatus Altiarchaeales archaeon ex4484_96]